jgi:hypothetical protein
MSSPSLWRFARKQNRYISRSRLVMQVQHATRMLASTHRLRGSDGMSGLEEFV